MREWLLDKKLHSYYFIFRWLIFLAIAYIWYAYPNIVVINLHEAFHDYAILALFTYLFLAQIVYFIFKNKKRQLSVCIKLLNVFDLLLLMALITVTNNWLSLFVPLLFIFIFYMTLTFSSGLRWVLFIVTISIYTGVGAVFNESFLDHLPLWLVQMLAFVFIFLMTNYIIRKNNDELAVHNLYTKEQLIDPITGLYTHRSFQNTLSKFLNMDKPFTLIVADINQFKRINETYGYDTGDHLLSTYGHTLLYFQREQNYFSFKYGVDQFFIILFETKKHHVQNYIYLWENLLEDSLKQIDHLNADDVSIHYGVLLNVTKETNDNVIERAMNALKEGRRLNEQIYYEQRKNGSRDD